MAVVYEVRRRRAWAIFVPWPSTTERQDCTTSASDGRSAPVWASMAVSSGTSSSGTPDRSGATLGSVTMAPPGSPDHDTMTLLDLAPSAATRDRPPIGAW